MMPSPPGMPPPPQPGTMLGVDNTSRPPGEPPVTEEEIRRWAWHRQPEERERVPFIGERLLVRRADWTPGDMATVTDVQDMTAPGNIYGAGDPDIHVWESSGRLRPDPWPWVTLRLDNDGPEIMCKEARVRGGPGWLRPGSRWDTSGRA